METEEIFWIFTKFAVYGVIYFLGRLNYGLSSLIPIFFTAFHDFKTRSRDLKRAKTQCVLGGHDRNAVLSRLDEIPAWVLFPDFERVEWFNLIIKRLWPFLNEILEKNVKGIEQKLNESPVLSTFKFTKVKLGQSVSKN